jgi:chemotaxis signal transduction protein
MTVGEETLALLRSSFDQVFAEAPRADHATRRLLLGLELGGDAFAIRVEETVGFERTRKLVVLPGARPTLRGLMGLRGMLVPVFSLAAVVGYEPAAFEPWLVLCGSADEPIGLAFSKLDGHFEAAATEIVSGAGTGGASRYVREYVQQGTVARGVLSLVSIVDDIRGTKER